MVMQSVITSLSAGLSKNYCMDFYDTWRKGMAWVGDAVLKF